MVSAEFLERLELSARQLRGSEAPFGGIQLVLSGDFFQLRAPARVREVLWYDESALARHGGPASTAAWHAAVCGCSGSPAGPHCK